MEDEGASRISRRRLIKGLGIASATGWLAPIVVTSLVSRAEATDCEHCGPCYEGNTNCGPDRVCGNLCVCGQGCGPLGYAFCSFDVDDNCFCWEDSFCSEVSDCTENSDCPPGYACIPKSCCMEPKCLPACGVGPRSHRRHGKLASGAVR